MYTLLSGLKPKNQNSNKKPLIDSACSKCFIYFIMCFHRLCLLLKTVKYISIIQNKNLVFYSTIPGIFSNDMHTDGYSGTHSECRVSSLSTRSTPD